MNRPNGPRLMSCLWPFKSFSLDTCGTIGPEIEDGCPNMIEEILEKDWYVSIIYTYIYSGQLPTEKLEPVFE